MHILEDYEAAHPMVCACGAIGSPERATFCEGCSLAFITATPQQRTLPSYLRQPRERWRASAHTAVEWHTTPLQHSKFIPHYTSMYPEDAHFNATLSMWQHRFLGSGHLTPTHDADELFKSLKWAILSSYETTPHFECLHSTSYPTCWLYAMATTSSCSITLHTCQICTRTTRKLRRERLTLYWLLTHTASTHSTTKHKHKLCGQHCDVIAPLPSCTVSPDVTITFDTCNIHKPTTLAGLPPIAAVATCAHYHGSRLDSTIKPHPRTYLS